MRLAADARPQPRPPRRSHASSRESMVTPAASISAKHRRERNLDLLVEAKLIARFEFDARRCGNQLQCRVGVRRSVGREARLRAAARRRLRSPRSRATGSSKCARSSHRRRSARCPLRLAQRVQEPLRIVRRTGAGAREEPLERFRGRFACPECAARKTQAFAGAPAVRRSRRRASRRATRSTPGKRLAARARAARSREDRPTAS